jgi:hypothetical protein
MGQKKKNKVKRFRLVNTLKRKDLKSFDLLPSLSINSKKLKYKVSYRINFRLFNIWLICRIN